VGVGREETTIFFVTIIIHFPRLTAVQAGSKNSTGHNDQALLIYCPAKNSLTIRYVLSVAAFCIRIYRSVRRSSSIKISCNLLAIIPVWMALVILNRTFSVAIFLLALLSSLEPLGDGALKVVTDGNCCIY
jgi:hypothetical protein